ncbi:hypothetical protein OEB99_16260 [Actinotalea sp. M2MS4P-6]|uniref:hypothetical protein n=1 Tax=Actinotalea sp. M2MS4P-6 TaxID=2983762 RepID=UPI0021E3943D|nr:hypothetical protein [Actinotalea sp. M2MS4P-6]MCV2395870.1 hypothetical protein [Actinotalea sp. M2MS4P-6]
MSTQMPEHGEHEELGLTYAGLVIGADSAEPVRATLSALRFSGYLGPVEQPAERPWLVAVADNPGGAVAGDRTGIAALTARLAERLGTTVLGATVLRDQVLRLDWAGPDAGHYDSDPSYGLPEDDETMPDPVGVDALEGLARACGRPDQAEDLTELLAEEIDRTSTYESERLRAALRLLGMPAWLIASDSLPRDVPGGPGRGEVARLRAGASGARGVARGLLVHPIRRRRTPRRTDH